MITVRNITQISAKKQKKPDAIAPGFIIYSLYYSLTQRIDAAKERCQEDEITSSPVALGP